MDSRMLIHAGILLAAYFIAALSQVLLKKAALREYDSLIKEYLNPTVIIAYLMLCFTTFMAVIAYRVVPLSLGAVLESTNYIHVTAFGVLLFGEKLSAKKVAALLLIITGIVVFALS